MVWSAESAPGRFNWNVSVWRRVVNKGEKI